MGLELGLGLGLGSELKLESGLGNIRAILGGYTDAEG